MRWFFDEDEVRISRKWIVLAVIVFVGIIVFIGMSCIANVAAQGMRF